MSKTSIRTCFCKSGYQDAKYGPGKRVFNEGKAKQAGQEKWRRTVCGKEAS